MSEERIDVLEERLSLYKMQKVRVNLDANIELKLRKTFPSLNQDIRLLNEMLTDLELIQDRKSEHALIPDVV